MSYIISFDRCEYSLSSRIGGKIAGLGELTKAGVPVPPGFAITTDAYEEFIKGGGIEGEIEKILSKLNLTDVTSIQKASEKIRQMMENLPIPTHIENAIRDAYRHLAEKCNISNLPVAVRSSATAEDLPGASFAGQQETFLWVKGLDNVMNSVKKCWSSLFTPRAIAYRIKMGIPHEKAYMSVGVQKMIDAKAAGVMFTLDYATGDLSKVIIEANWGLGETVVSGLVTPDKYVVDIVTFDILKKEIYPSGKTLEYVVNPQTGEIEHREIDANRQNMPCLKDEEIIELAKFGKLIRKYFNRPQDIEWAIDRNLSFPENIFILQSRPETVWSQRKAEPIAKTKSFIELVTDKLISLGKE